MTIKSKVTEWTLKTIEEIAGSKLTLGRLIWAIRESLEISQSTFAKQLGISKQHLCDIEHDRKTISPKLAAEYAEKLAYSKKQFVRLSLQDLVNRAGLNMIVETMPRAAWRLILLTKLVWI